MMIFEVGDRFPLKWSVDIGLRHVEEFMTLRVIDREHTHEGDYLHLHIEGGVGEGALLKFHIKEDEEVCEYIHFSYNGFMPMILDPFDRMEAD